MHRAILQRLWRRSCCATNRGRAAETSRDMLNQPTDQAEPDIVPATLRAIPPSVLPTARRQSSSSFTIWAAGRVLGWATLYVLLAAGTFTFPDVPAHDLDPSWRMALGYFYEH